MPVKLTATEFAEKQGRRLKAAIEDIRSGVSKVTEAPGAKAASKKLKWQAAMSKQETMEKWAKRISAVPLEEWKADMIEKGIGRIPAGIDRAKGKVEKFAAALIDHQNRGLEKLARMPDLTLEDSINRATTWIRHMSEMKY